MTLLSFVAQLLLASAVSAGITSSTTQTDILAAKGLVNLGVREAQEIASGKPKGCKLSQVSVRREWGSLSHPERKAYVDAVLCLASKPSKSDPSAVPGARNRYDDFVAVHIQQTLSIHGTGNFLSWHRYFTWAYEQALRNECGYKGYQPYWNWGKYAQDPINSPIFDGSSYSMSGNGVYEKHGPALIPSPLTPLITIPPGVGGGCVTTGPFKNWTVHLGPLAPGIDTAIPTATGLSYNPRCLKRDISVFASSNWSKDSDTASLIANYPTISSFQQHMQGDGFVNGFLGVHTAGHFTIGGDPGGDLFASPGDPAFFLHHAQIDRVWWMWQNQDLKGRQYAVGDTITINNQPPSRNATLEDVIDLGVVGSGPVTIGGASSTLDGKFCYIYV